MSINKERKGKQGVHDAKVHGHGGQMPDMPTMKDWRTGYHCDIINAHSTYKGDRRHVDPGEQGVSGTKKKGMAGKKSY